MMSELVTLVGQQSSDFFSGVPAMSAGSPDARNSSASGPVSDGTLGNLEQQGNLAGPQKPTTQRPGVHAAQELFRQPPTLCVSGTSCHEKYISE